MAKQAQLPDPDVEGAGLKLTPKQARFVAEYLIDLNATQAAARAGYSAKTANEQGARLLASASVKSAIAAGKARQIAAAGLSAERVLEEFRRLAFVDMRAFYREDGSLKSPAEMTPEQGSQLAALETVRKNTAAGDGVVDTVDKIKLWDKVRALESLAKHFGVLTERVEHGGEVTFRWAE